MKEMGVKLPKMFNDKKYALNVWTADKVQRLEEDWLQQKERWYKLLEPLVPSGNTQALDVGCGIGMFYPFLMGKSNNYVGIDPTDAMVNRACERHPDGDFKTGTVYNLQFPNNWFDLVFCWSVLYHLPHETMERAIRELWRVTKKTLLFNLYMALDEGSFSVRGSWNEWLTVMDSFWIMQLLNSLNPEKIDIVNYEGVSLLDEKRFQRKIFRLKRGKS